MASFDIDYPAELIDRFGTNKVFKEPVIGSDGVTYEKEILLKVFADQKASNPPQPTTYPSGMPYNGEPLKSDDVMKSVIEAHRVAHVTQTLAKRNNTKSMFNMGACLSLLDEFRPLLKETLDGWEPPCVVLLGPEQTGKSTVLERLTMLPIFPRGAQGALKMTTQAAVHVRLRRGESKGAIVQVIKIVDGKEDPTPTFSWTYTWDEAQKEVSKKMLDLTKDKELKISTDSMIVITISHPAVPSINLIDLPGLVSIGEYREQITSLIVHHLNVYKDRAIFLCVHNGLVNVNQNYGFELIKDHGLQSKTLGVVTHCDGHVYLQGSHDGLRVYVDGDDGSLAPHGYVLVANKPRLVGSPVTDFEIPDFPDSPFLKRVKEVIQISDLEERFFNENGMAHYVANGKATSNAMVKRVDDIFALHLTETWLPNTVHLVSEQLKSFGNKLLGLGYPEFDRTKFLAGPEERINFLKCVSTVLDGFIVKARDRVHRFSLDVTKECIQHAVSSENGRAHPIVHGNFTVNVDQYADAEEYIVSLQNKLEAKLQENVEKLRDLWLSSDNNLLTQLQAMNDNYLLKIMRFDALLQALATWFNEIVKQSIDAAAVAASNCIKLAFDSRPSSCLDISICEQQAGDESDSINIVIHIHKLVRDTISSLVGKSTLTICESLKTVLSNTIKGNTTTSGPRLELTPEQLIQEKGEVALERVTLHENIQKLELVRIKLLKTIIGSAVIALRNREPLQKLYVTTLEHHTRVLSASSLTVEEYAALVELAQKPTTKSQDLAQQLAVTHLAPAGVDDIIAKINFVSVEANKKTADSATFEANCTELVALFDRHASPLMDGIGDFGHLFTHAQFTQPTAETEARIRLCTRAIWTALGLADEGAARSAFLRNRSAMNAVNNLLTNKIIDAFVPAARRPTPPPGAGAGRGARGARGGAAAGAGAGAAADEVNPDDIELEGDRDIGQEEHKD